MSIAVHPGFANSFSDTLDRNTAVPTVTGSPFRDIFAVAASSSPEQTSHVPGGISGSSSVFDPFSVVRSGAVPEDNAFVLALKRMMGLVIDPPPILKTSDALTLNMALVPTENVQSAPTPMESSSNPDRTPQPSTDLSQLISSSIEESAEITTSQALMDTVLKEFR